MGWRSLDYGQGGVKGVGVADEIFPESQLVCSKQLVNARNSGGRLVVGQSEVDSPHV